MPLMKVRETSSSQTQLTRSQPGRRHSLIDSGRESLRTHLQNLYGEEITNKTSIFSRLRHKLSNLLSSLAFLSRCRDNNVIPKFLKLKDNFSTRSSRKILNKASMSLLRDHIQKTRRDLDFISRDLLKIHLELANTLSPLDWSLFDRITHHQAQKTLELNAQKQSRKFQSLLPKPRASPHKSNQKTVVNLSSYSLSEPENTLLSKGLNFSIAPKKIPTEQIVSAVESSVKGLPKGPADLIRFETAKILQVAKPPKPNLSKEERIALKNLKSNSDIVILPADKGNATVILNKIQYEEKILGLLQDGSYSPISRDPTARIEREITKLLKTSDIPDNTLKRLIPRNSKPPRIYGLPKIHKPDVPLRPIVSTLDSPTYTTAQYVAGILKEYVGKSSSHILNSRHFIQQISEITLDPGDILVSFDVTSLFTKVPVPDSLSLIRKLLTEDGKPTILGDLVEKCLTSTYFTFQGKFHKQTSGTPMGSPLSPVIANIFMEDFETKAIASSKLKPKTWLRYMDDTFVIWPHGQHTLPTFQNHLNSQHPDIQFTMEIENNNSIPFLDVLISRLPHGHLGHSVYRKPTHTDRYLNAKSHHHPAQKFSVINSLVQRAIAISQPENLNSELNHLRNSLVDNGYPKHQIQSTIQRRLNPSPNKTLHPNTEFKSTAFLPYVQNVTERLSKLLKKHKIKTIFKPATKVSQILPSTKDPRQPLDCKGIYSIPCSCGVVYIGETGRSIKTRITEHKRCLKSGLFSNSAVAEHQLQTGHQILFENSKVVSKANHFYDRKIREAIEIHKNPNNINRDEGYMLSSIWKPTINSITKPSPPSSPFPPPPPLSADQSNPHPPPTI